MTGPVIVTCAVAGGIVTGNPNQPDTREDVIGEVRAARDAGAAVAHVRARFADVGISQAPEGYLAIKRAVRADPHDIVLNFTTGGKLGLPPEDISPELSLTTALARTVLTNHGDPR